MHPAPHTHSLRRVPSLQLCHNLLLALRLDLDGTRRTVLDAALLLAAVRVLHRAPQLLGLRAAPPNTPNTDQV